MDKKVHYKMHKVKKQWVTIAVTGLSLGAVSAVSLGTNDGVVQADDGTDILSQLALLLENENAVLDSVGEVVSGQSQLAQGAHHAAAFHASKLAFFDFGAVYQGGAV